MRGLTLCDTTGMAYPTQVETLCAPSIARHPSLEFTAHFHNTRAMAFVNTVAAVDAGIRRFDMSLGGIGGCPYAPARRATLLPKMLCTCSDAWGTTGMTSKAQSAPRHGYKHGATRAGEPAAPRQATA